MRNETASGAGVAFFSVLLAFGLQHLLDQPAGGDLNGLDMVLCFIAAVFLLLRFVYGSALHLKFEYSEPQTDAASAKWLAYDLTMLTVFGLIGIWMCWSKTRFEFLLLSATVAFFGLIWGTPEFLGFRRSKYAWTFWRVDVAQLAVNGVALLLLFSPCATQRISGASPAIGFLVVAYALLLAWDFWGQMKTIQAGPRPAKP